MSDRITRLHGGQPAAFDDEIDEIVATGADVHLEMMSERSAWLRVGRDIFWIFAARPRSGLLLSVRYTERWPESNAVVSHPTGEDHAR